MNAQAVPHTIVLEPEKKSAAVLEFGTRLHARIIGQDEAVDQLVSVYQMIKAGMSIPGRPIANLLFLGPTGSGKTRLVEAAAEIIFGNPKAFIKIDCAEFQHSHEIAKLIGSPPGYIGHRETAAVLTQEAIDRLQTESSKFTFVLFDEIEKASDALWQLLLGILDKGALTLGDNRKTDFSRTIVFMTSNLGSSEMGKLMSGGIGFAPKLETAPIEMNRRIYRVAVDAAKRRFSPEFMNRIDKVVVFRTLGRDDLHRILDIELSYVQDRILSSRPEGTFAFRCTTEAKEFLLREGIDPNYGARHLKRVIERELVFPLSSLMSTEQIQTGDVVAVDLAADGRRLVFTKAERDLPHSHDGGGIPPQSHSEGGTRPYMSCMPMWRAAGR